MNKETQNLAWKCLPKEARVRIKIAYKSDYVSDRGYQPTRGMEVLQDVFGHQNLTSNTEPEEMLMIERADIIEKYKAILVQQDPKNFGYSDYLQGQKDLLENLYASKCVPDTPDSSNLANIGKDELGHRLEQTVQESVQVKSKPKFKVGDKVKIVNVANPMMRDEIGIIKALPTKDESRYEVGIDDGWTLLEAKYLEPYTEENKEAVEEKELNIYELLKGCIGDTFFHPHYGDVELSGVDEKSILITHNNCTIVIVGFTAPTGMAYLYPDAESLKKYPFDGKVAWSEWASERKPNIEQEIHNYAKINSVDNAEHNMIEGAVIYGLELSLKFTNKEINDYLYG